MMRVWIVNQYAANSANRHQVIARKLAQRGHDVTVIASSFSHLTHQDTIDWGNDVYRIQSQDGIRLVFLKTIPYHGNNLSRIFNMVAFAMRVWLGTGTRKLEKPDFVIGSNPQLFAVWAAERLARRKKAQFVCEIRDLWPQTWVDLNVLPQNHPIIWILGKLETYLYRSAEVIATTLPQAADYMVTKGIDKEKVVWVPNGVDFDYIPPLVPPKEQQKFTVMYTGSHGYANDLNSILDAISILKKEGSDDLQFIFIGDGPEKPELEKRAEEEGLDNVSFKPPVPRVDIYPLMQTADALIVNVRDSPLYRYGISLNKMFDYLASGRPIVMAADAPCNPVVESGAGLVVSPQDSAAMAKAVQEIMKMPLSERWEMGKKGRAYAEEHHDFEKIAIGLEGVLLGLEK